MVREKPKLKQDEPVLCSLRAVNRQLYMETLEFMFYPDVMLCFNVNPTLESKDALDAVQMLGYDFVIKNTVEVWLEFDSNDEDKSLYYPIHHVHGFDEGLRYLAFNLRKRDWKLGSSAWELLRQSKKERDAALAKRVEDTRTALNSLVRVNGFPEIQKEVRFLACKKGHVYTFATGRFFGDILKGEVEVLRRWLA